MKKKSSMITLLWMQIAFHRYEDGKWNDAFQNSSLQKLKNKIK